MGGKSQAKAALITSALVLCTVASPSFASTADDYEMTLRIEAIGPHAPQEVAACLGKRSGVGLAVTNKSRYRRRRFSLLKKFIRSTYQLDPAKPLTNEIRHLTVILTEQGSGTRAQLFLRGAYKLRRSDRSILLRCLGLPTE